MDVFRQGGFVEFRSLNSKPLLVDVISQCFEDTPGVSTTRSQDGFAPISHFMVFSQSTYVKTKTLPAQQEFRPWVQQLVGRANPHTVQRILITDDPAFLLVLKDGGVHIV